MAVFSVSPPRLPPETTNAAIALIARLSSQKTTIAPTSRACTGRNRLRHWPREAQPNTAAGIARNSTRGTSSTHWSADPTVTSTAKPAAQARTTRTQRAPEISTGRPS